MVSHEPPFTRWLYEYVYRTVGSQFIVETQRDNLKDVGEGLLAEKKYEYASSQPDLVIRRESSKEPLMIAMLHLDIPSIEENITAMVAELKLRDDSGVPVWECFRNMSATGAAIAMEYLASGTIINTIVVYGVVVRVKELEHAKLIQLTLDFSTGDSQFYVCRKDIPLDLLLNAVVTVI